MKEHKIKHDYDLLLKMYLKAVYNYNIKDIVKSVDENNNAIYMLLTTKDETINIEPLYNYYNKLYAYVIINGNKIDYIVLSIWNIIHNDLDLNLSEIVFYLNDMKKQLPKKDKFKGVVKRMINLIIQNNWSYFKYDFVDINKDNYKNCFILFKN